MPLSEDEQRILRQIEQELRSDPTFDARSADVSAVRMVWMSIALLVGVIGTVAALTVHPFVAFGCFVLVLLIGLRLEGETRSLVRERLSDVEVQTWISGFPGRRPGPDVHDR